MLCEPGRHHSLAAPYTCMSRAGITPSALFCMSHLLTNPCKLLLSWPFCISPCLLPLLRRPPVTTIHPFSQADDDDDMFGVEEGGSGAAPAAAPVMAQVESAGGAGGAPKPISGSCGASPDTAQEAGERIEDSMYFSWPVKELKRFLQVGLTQGVY